MNASLAPASAPAANSPKSRGSLGRFWGVGKCSISYWSTDHAATLGAALAFYCAFSLAPLLIIIVAIAGWVVGAEAAYGQLHNQLTSLFGQGTAGILLAAMKSSQSGRGLVSTCVSIISLLVGATTVFTALESALEQIWGVQADAPSGWKGFLRTRVLSLGVILAIGFLLLVSLSISTAMAGLRSYVAHRFTGAVIFAGTVDFVLSTAMITLLIALIYRYMPARRLPWNVVGWGALVTALLFHLGRWAIGLYLGKSTQPSAFGAAASFAALLLWLYYTAQIFFLGAEFTACLGGIKKNPLAMQSAAK
jgi:membrane protein